MAGDAEATKSRILGAAAAEFATHGIAGARVDRIARSAKANKQLIYAYFGSKHGLFETVLAEELSALTEVVRFDADDLPGYAGRLFDHMVAHPGLVRLATWRRLEWPDAADIFVPLYKTKVTALSSAQRQGRLEGWAQPVDVLTLVIALAAAWVTAAPELHDIAPGDPWSARRLATHRKAVVEAVRRLSVPPAG